MAANYIVTGHDEVGRSQVVIEGPVPNDEPFEHVPGFHAALFWKTPANPHVGDTAENPIAIIDSVLPPVGGTCAMFVTFPPEDPHAPAPSEEQQRLATCEMMAKLPGLAGEFEADAPGFHATNTIDYGVLLSGELTLHLDTGAPKKITAGDVVIQMGTRHAWRNTGNTPARMMFVMVDAVRK